MSADLVVLVPPEDLAPDDERALAPNAAGDVRRFRMRTVLVRAEQRSYTVIGYFEKAAAVAQSIAARLEGPGIVALALDTQNRLIAVRTLRSTSLGEMMVRDGEPHQRVGVELAETALATGAAAMLLVLVNGEDPPPVDRIDTCGLTPLLDVLRVRADGSVDSQSGSHLTRAQALTANARAPRGLLGQASRATWFHGSPEPLPRDLRELRWDRDRTTSDGNAEGAGWYWTSDAEEAASYGRCVHTATLRPGARLIGPSTRPTAAALRTLYDFAERDDQVVFLSNWGYDEDAVDQRRVVAEVLARYQRQATLLDAAVMLYHDLYRHDAPAFVRGMGELADAAVVPRGTTGGSRERLHLVVYNPRALDLTRDCVDEW